MAELADALDSGSSRGNSVEVQVLLPAPPKSLENSEFSRFLVFSFCSYTAVGGTHDLWLCVCRFSVRGEGFRSECAVLIVNVKVTAEGGFEVNIDRQLSVLFVDDDVVYQQPQVGIADRTVLMISPRISMLC